MIYVGYITTRIWFGVGIHPGPECDLDLGMHPQDPWGKFWQETEELLTAPVS